MQQNQKGFSLIELLIVVVIIGIISAIAIPNLVASRRAANEGAALSATRSLSSAEHIYYATVGSNAAYGAMSDLRSQKLIDQVLSSATSADASKSGYYYTITAITGNPTSPADFVISANPAIPPSNALTATGSRRFCITSNGLLRGDTSAESVVATQAECAALDLLKN